MLIYTSQSFMKKYEIVVLLLRRERGAGSVGDLVLTTISLVRSLLVPRLHLQEVKRRRAAAETAGGGADGPYY